MKTDTTNPFENEIGNLGGNNYEDTSLMEETDSAIESISKNEYEDRFTVGHKIATPEERKRNMFIDKDNNIANTGTKVGENIHKNADIRAGWIPVDRELLQERDVFYPESWEFRVRPATVEAIKAWSTIDENNAQSVLSVFNEILKTCLSIYDRESGMPIPWLQLNSWDRFFFILLIRNYTFENGESKIEYDDECQSCDSPITFKLDAVSLYYDIPDPEVMKYWDRESRTWVIDTEEFGLDKGVLTLYVPTVEKDTNLMEYITERYREKGRISKEQEIFLKYLVWLLPKAPKDNTLLKRKVREAEIEFDSWSVEEFTFIDQVVRNIEVVPSTKLKTQCPNCGEEATSDIQFPDGIRSLFTIQSRFKKFGSK